MRPAPFILLCVACGSPALRQVDDVSVGVVTSGHVVRGAAPEKRGPPYPIVLAHGFFGFDDFAGVDQLGYFYGVKEALASHGERQVFTPAVDPFNSSEERGAQLLARVEEVLEETGASKVVLVGHSQGGLDARLVAHERPELVAAVVTVGTPHRGTPMGDLGTRVLSDPAARAAVDALVRLFGGTLWEESRKESSLFAALEQFAQPGILAFNTKYPDARGVAYFSIAGRSGLRLGTAECAAGSRPGFITAWDSEVDPTNVALSASERWLEQNLFDPQANDGLVAVDSAKWGRFLGCVPADHLDEIGQPFGAVPGAFNAWRHTGFYVELVAWLRAQGY